MAKKPLELAQMIQSLRAELARAQPQGEDEAIRFTVEDVELELSIVAEEQAEGGIAARFYVLTSHFKGSKKDAVTQKIKLRLTPEVSGGEAGSRAGKPLKVGAKRKARG